MKNYLNYLLLVLLFALFSCKNTTYEDKIPNKYKALFRDLDVKVNKDVKGVIHATDSLLNLSSTHSLNHASVLKIYTLRQQAFAKERAMDSVFSNGVQVRTLASAINDSLTIANSLMFIKGTFDFSHLQAAEKYFPGAIRTFGKMNMLYNKAVLENLYSVILIQKGDFVTSQTLLLDAYEIMIKLDSVAPLFNVCMNMANNYNDSKSSRNLAIKYYTKALSIAQQMNDTVKQAAVLMNMGLYYDEPGIDSSLYYYNQALHILSSYSKDNMLKMKLNYNIANYYLSKGNYTTAEQDFIKLVEYGKQNNALETIVYAKKGLSSVYYKTSQYNKAIDQLSAAIQIMDTLGMKHETMTDYGDLMQLYKKAGNAAAALKTAEIYINLKDSLQSVEKQIAVQELEEKYHSDKREMALLNLKQVSSLRLKMVVFLSLAILLLLFLWRRSHILSKEKEASYHVLMQQYKQEKEERTQLAQNTITVEENANVELLKRLQTYYEDEKPYLNPKLKIDDIAVYLNKTQKEILQALKIHNFSNINVFTNKFRVEEVRRLFEDPAYNHVKLESIGEQAGFGSKTSFYTAFELFTGMKPGYYRSKINDGL